MKIIQMIMLSYLFVLSYQDIRKKKIAIWLLCLGGGIVIASLFFMRGILWWERAAGALVGILMLGVSQVTKESIGKADCILILFIGLMEGYLCCICSLCYATFLCCILCIALLGFRIMTKKQRIPFIPFLWVGYFCDILLRMKG